MEQDSHISVSKLDFSMTSGISKPGSIIIENHKTVVLQPGMIVAFEDEEGRLLRVLQEGKVWGMFPLEEAPPAPSPEGAIKRVRSVPLACLFAVETRGGRYYGFRSLGAEGRLLQAVRGSSKPHRVANHNFGSWESWEMCPSHGLVNVAWAKALGWSITEMRAVPRTAFRDAEMAQIKGVRALREQALESNQRAREVSRQLAEEAAALDSRAREAEDRAARAARRAETAEGRVEEATRRALAAERDVRRAEAALAEMNGMMGRLAEEKAHLARQLRKVKEEAEAGRQRQAAQEAGNEPSLAFTDDEAEPEEERMREREAQVQRLRREYEAIKASSSSSASLRASKDARTSTATAPARATPRHSADGDENAAPGPRTPPRQTAPALGLDLNRLGRMMSDIGLREPTPEKLRASADAPVPITFRAGGALTFGPRTPHAHPEQPSPADSPIKQETSAEVSPSRALPDAASALSPVSHRDLATPRGSDRAALEDSGDEEGCPEGSTAEGSVGGAEAEGARSMAWRGHRGSAFTARDVDRTGEDAGYGYGYDLDRDGDGVDDSEMARECEDLDGALSWGAPPRHRGQPVPLPRQALSRKLALEVQQEAARAQSATESSPSMAFLSPEASISPNATKENVQPGPGTPLSPSEMVCRMTNPDSPSDARILADILADPATHLRHSRETPEGRESPFKKRPGPPSPPQQAGPVKRGLLQNAQSNSTWNDKGTGAGAVSQPAKGKSSFLSRLPLHRIDDVDLYTEHLGR